MGGDEALLRVLVQPIQGSARPRRPSGPHRIASPGAARTRGRGGPGSPRRDRRRVRPGRVLSTFTRPRACAGRNRSAAVSNSEQRISRLISAMVRPAASEPRTRFSDLVGGRRRLSTTRERGLHAREDLPDALPLVDTADPLEDHRRHRCLVGDADVRGDLALLELELARRATGTGRRASPRPWP